MNRYSTCLFICILTQRKQNEKQYDAHMYECERVTLLIPDCEFAVKKHYCEQIAIRKSSFILSRLRKIMLSINILIRSHKNKHIHFFFY